MPLPGVTPFPPEFAARYRARGYWDDQPLIAPFLKVFADYAGRAAVIAVETVVFAPGPTRHVYELAGVRSKGVVTLLSRLG